MLEAELIDMLRQAFPFDRFEDVKKGARIDETGGEEDGKRERIQGNQNKSHNRTYMFGRADHKKNYPKLIFPYCTYHLLKTDFSA